MLGGIGFVRFIKIKFKSHQVKSKPSAGGLGQAGVKWRAAPLVSIENMVHF